MLQVIAKTFQEIINNFYDPEINIELVDSMDTASCSGKHIELPIPLLEQFNEAHLPRFTVMYHEMAHALYTKPLTDLIDKWKNIPNPEYQQKYFHLLNWIEDYYIEETLEKNYPYLHDIVGCLRKLPVEYDMDLPEYAFHRYYVKRDTTMGSSFINYIERLLTMRRNPMFGKGPISRITKNLNYQFIELVIEFYTWCTVHDIFPKDKTLPALQMPVMVLSSSTPSNLSGDIDDDTDGDIDDDTDSDTDDDTDSDTDDDTDGDTPGLPVSDGAGDHTEGEEIVTQVLPTFKPTKEEIFVKQYNSEQKIFTANYIKKYETDSVENNLSGMFSSTLQDSSIISNKVIVKNFFNPNRLIDQVLFRTPKRCFNNVSIYRDVSGSICSQFNLVDTICSYLIERIPIDSHFYLYGTNIAEVPYKSWTEEYNSPYDISVGWGTDSARVADIISQQFNDKWLNIIITDGDLYTLYERENISTLLNNIFVVSLTDLEYDIDPSHLVVVKDIKDIPEITKKLLKI